MKRILTTFALGAIAISALLSCDNGKSDGKKEKVTFPTPEYIESALLIDIPEGKEIEVSPKILEEMTDVELPKVKADKTVKIKTIETTESAKVFIEVIIPSEALAEDLGPIAPTAKKNLNGDITLCVEGTFEGDKKYEKDKEIKYTIKDKKGSKKIANVTLVKAVATPLSTKASNSCSITFTPANSAYGSATTVNASVSVNIPTGNALNLCMAFKVNRTVIEVTGGDLKKTVGNWWNGCDLDVIAKWLKDNGVKIKDDLSGYNILNISFTGNKTILFSFSNAEPFKGTYNLNGDKITYDLTASDGGNSFINAKGSGTVSWEMVQKTACCVLKLNSTITNGSTTYKGTVEFDLVPAK